MMRVLQSLALLAVIWLAGECAWTVHQLRPKLAVTLENVDRTVIVAGVAATHFEKATGEWEKSSQEQSKAVTSSISGISSAASSVNAAAVRLTSLISAMDNSVNSQLIPALTTSVEQQNAALLKSQEKLQANLDSSQKVLADADSVISSPKLQETLASTAESSANLATATREGAATMAKVHQGVEYEVNELMKPVKKVKVAILFIAQLAGKFLGY